MRKVIGILTLLFINSYVSANNLLGLDLNAINQQTSRNIACKLSGKVIKVVDGDSIVILDSNNKQHKIRLAGIDAPEYRQPFAKAAKKYLSRLIDRKAVCIDWYKQDIYKRKIGKVILKGADINFKMVNKGLAWHYKYYQKDQTKLDQKTYTEAEKNAQSATVGLWSEPDPIPPWRWRQGKRKKKISRADKSKMIQVKRRAKAPVSGFSCGSKYFCKHMMSCAEARFYLTQCGLVRLDRDRDGIPCESICGQ
ncbi:MAG: thermonuclease family protein [Thiotrichaceae bacterium]|nr:thermonuclease family protein [Thiotrichaceae bacterium]